MNIGRMLPGKGYFFTLLIFFQEAYIKGLFFYSANFQSPNSSHSSAVLSNTSSAEICPE